MKKIASLLLLPLSLLGQQNQASLFNDYIQGQAKFYGFNGNVLVAKNGVVIYQKSVGYADYTTKKKLDANSIFDCGSIAKEFTAAGILLLKDEGKIRYTDTLRKFFPELPYSNVTVQQLLTHTSGMPDGFDLVTKYFDHSKMATNDDMIRLLAREKPPLLFTPGEDLRYSGTAFNLLASIIEKLSGQSFVTYMAERIFKPLGMTHTQVADGPRTAVTIPGYAYGFVYVDSLKRQVRADSLYPGWSTYLAGINGEGMIITTTGDLLKWDRALKNHSLLTAATQKEMLSLQAEKKVVPKVGFGYGIRVGENDFGKYVFHNGSYPGFVSMLIRYIDDDVTAVVLSNNESHADYMADGLVALALDKKLAMPYVHQPISVATPVDKFTGSYLMPRNGPPYMSLFPTQLLVKENKLFIQQTGMPEVELKQESATKFFFADGTDRQLEFEMDGAGKPLKTCLIIWGVKREASPIK